MYAKLSVSTLITCGSFIIEIVNLCFMTLEQIYASDLGMCGMVLPSVFTCHIFTVLAMEVTNYRWKFVGGHIQTHRLVGWGMEMDGQSVKGIKKQF